MKAFHFLALLVAASPASAGVHPPEIEARLAEMVGDWTIEGQETVYRERCDWFRDRSFVVCTSEDIGDNSISQSIIGYSKAEGHFTYHNFGNSGASRSETGFAHGDRGLVFTSERRGADGLARSTITLTPLPDGRVRFRQERSVDGGPWTSAADFHFVARRQ